MSPARTISGYLDFKLPDVSSKGIESPAGIYSREITPPQSSNGSINGDALKEAVTVDEGLRIQDTTVDGIAAPLAVTDTSNTTEKHTQLNQEATIHESAPVNLEATEEALLPAYDPYAKEKPRPKTIKEITEDVVAVLERYRLPHPSDVSKTWGAKKKFLVQVERFVTKNEAVCMVLPAFPFKSPNKKTKVLGDLPDKGEEVALQHLDGLCKAIADVYPGGAKVFIVSDGLMYNGKSRRTSYHKDKFLTDGQDLLGVSDQEVWRYGQALRQMAKDFECNNLNFVRLRDLIDQEGINEPLSEEAYLKDAPSFRDGLYKQYLPENFDPEVQIANDADMTLTYRGYIKFLETDLANSNPESEQKSKAQHKRYREEVAKSMIGRGKVIQTGPPPSLNPYHITKSVCQKAFANAIASKFSSHVRLSIHPSTETNKLSMALIPQQGRNQMTPWHSTLIQAIDGSITMSHALSVPARTHDLVFYPDGRPSHFRERSPLFHWPGMNVSFDYMYPTGLIISPTDPSSKYSLHNVHMQKVRGLAEHCSPIVLRNFQDTTDEHTFESKAYDLGAVAPWTFGVKQKVKDAGRNDRMANNVVSSEAMPMHYDGMFKFVKKVDEKTGEETSVSNPPRFQYFTSITPCAPGSGYTLFASSARFFQHLPPAYTLEELQALTWDCKNSGFWDNHMRALPLIVPHPTSGKPCVRWHEPWPEWKTKFANCVINIENGSNEYIKLVDQMLYDRRVCLYFSWQKGDVLVSDNFAMLHTRTAFEGESDRELWRIHFD